MKLFDAHTHIYLATEHWPVAEYLRLAQAAGVAWLVDAGTHTDDIAPRVATLAQYPQVIRGAALGPHDADRVGADELAVLERTFASKQASCLAECGLDYYHQPSEAGRAHQRHIFAQQLALAKRRDLPVCLHIRDAWEDARELVKSAHVRSGLVHCFTGSPAEARAFLDLGFLISFSGIVTFKSSQVLREAARFVPVTQLVTETDSPWLAPAPVRGTPNHSGNLVHTNRFIAELRNDDVEHFNEQVYRTCCTFFNVPIEPPVLAG